MRDWHAWHEQYDDRGSGLARRLDVVRHEVGRGLSWLETEGVDHPRLVSMCAGDGRDVLPVLANGHPTVAATLVELDPELAERARADADRLGLAEVAVRNADAGLLASYRGCGPAHVMMACGVFGNVADGDVVRTIEALPHLLAPDALVVWTRGNRVTGPSSSDDDPSERVRAAFLEHGFCEVAFVRPEDATYRVGVARLTDPPRDPVDDLRMFTFV